jgi:hypothetical protein
MQLFVAVLIDSYFAFIKEQQVTLTSHNQYIILYLVAGNMS